MHLNIGTSDLWPAANINNRNLDWIIISKSEQMVWSCLLPRDFCSIPTAFETQTFVRHVHIPLELWFEDPWSNLRNQHSSKVHFEQHCIALLLVNIRSNHDMEKTTEWERMTWLTDGHLWNLQDGNDALRRSEFICGLMCTRSNPQVPKPRSQDYQHCIPITAGIG